MSKIILILIKKAPLFTTSQLERLASICADVAQIAFGSMVLPFIFDKPTTWMVLLGLVSSLFFWITALVFERKRDESR